MKILQVNKFFYRRGGAEQHFFDLRDLLTSRGEEVIDFSMRDKRNEPSPFAEYFVANREFGRTNWRTLARPCKIIYSGEAKRKISRLIKATRPEVAHLHLIYHHLTPSILVALKKANIPTVMTIHDWKPLCPNYHLYTEGRPCVRCRGGHYWQAARHRCLRGSLPASALVALEAYYHHFRRYYEDYIDLLIAPSDFAKEMFVLFGWPEEKIEVLPHFLPAAIKPVSVPPPLPEERRFAYVGRLSPEKGVDRLVDFWIKEKIRYPLDLYGDGPLYETLGRALKKNSAAAKKIRRLGRAPREQILARLDDYAAVIMPSVCYETFGLTAIEAWSRGVPVVANQLGSFVELLEKSGAGLLFDWSSGDRFLTEALEKIQSPAYRQRAVAYIKNNHRPDEYYRRLKQIYERLIAAAR